MFAIHVKQSDKKIHLEALRSYEGTEKIDTSSSVMKVSAAIKDIRPETAVVSTEDRNSGVPTTRKD